MLNVFTKHFPAYVIPIKNFGQNYARNNCKNDSCSVARCSSLQTSIERLSKLEDRVNSTIWLRKNREKFQRIDFFELHTPSLVERPQKQYFEFQTVWNCARRFPVQELWYFSVYQNVLRKLLSLSRRYSVWGWLVSPNYILQQTPHCHRRNSLYSRLAQDV